MNTAKRGPALPSGQRAVDAPSGATPAKPPRRLTARQRQKLFGLWKALSPSLAIESANEREARLIYANRVFGRESAGPGPPPLQSWSELTTQEAAKLIRRMRDDLGRSPADRAAMIIARLSHELWGADAEDFLRRRLLDRFGVADPARLAPSDYHAAIEELLSRVAYRDHPALSGAALHEKIETLRVRFRKAEF